MVKPIPVVVAGFGYWARNGTVLPLLKKFPGMMQVVGIASINKTEFEQIIEPEFRKNGWSIPKQFNDLQDAFDPKYLGKEKFVAVLVTTPNAFHFRQAKIAIEAGCHVYVERPIVTANDDLPILVEIAERHKVLLFTGTQRRLEAPFQYLQSAVVQNYHFGQLRRIRCHLAVQHHLKDWRRRSDLAGGGIVTDSGHHLLDIAAWIVNSTSIEIPARLQGSVHFSFHESHPTDGAPLDVESEAVGYVELPGDILLSFDFTYNAPKNSVYEQIELSDQNCVRIKLTREQARRTALPGTITHQLANGKFAEIKAVDPRQGVRAEAIRFSDEAQGMKPLWMFIETVRKGYNNAQGTEVVQARTSISTWRLVREIYRLASTTRITGNDS